jgi:hypothetical protein
MLARSASSLEFLAGTRPSGFPCHLILKGGAAETINAKMVQVEARKRELEQALSDGASAAAPP